MCVCVCVCVGERDINETEFPVLGNKIDKPINNKQTRTLYNLKEAIVFIQA